MGPTALVGLWGWSLGSEAIGLVVGFCVGIGLVAWLVPNRMLVYNAEWTGYVTQNTFTGTMVPYGPGLHLSHWWEERNKDGNYSLKVTTQPFTASVATQTAQVIVSGKYGYAIDLARIVRAIGVDESTIESGLTAFIDSFLTNWCSREGMTAEKVRSTINDLNAALALEFMGEENGGEERTKLEEAYGFITVSVVIDNIAFSPATQKTRDALDEAEVLLKIVARIYGHDPQVLAEKIRSGEISIERYNTMISRAMAASDNATKMEVKVVEAAGIPELIDKLPALIDKLVDRFTKGDKS